MILFWLLIFTLLTIALLCVTWPILRAPASRYLATSKDYVGLVLLCSVITCLALGLYLNQGSSAALKQTLALQQRTAALQTLLAEINHNPQKAIAMMQIYLQNHPQDKRAWYLLSQLYRSVGDLRQAKAAVKRSKNL